MKYKKILLIFFIVLIGIISCKKDTSPNKNEGLIQLISAKIGSSTLNSGSTLKNVPYDQPVQITFSTAVDTNSIIKAITLKSSIGTMVAYNYSSTNSYTALTLTPASFLQYSTDYTLAISSDLRGINGETFTGAQFKFTTVAGSMVIDSISLNGNKMTASPLQNIDPKKINIKVAFSQALDPNNYKSSFSFTGPPLSFTISADYRTLLATVTATAKGLTMYSFSISSNLTSAGGFTFAGSSYNFYTGIDSTYQFTQIADDDLLTLVQQQTFKYFWDFGHPSCGMARERNT